MATNRYPGTCTKCGNTVAAGEGSLQRGQGGWETSHQDDVCEQVELIQIYNFSPETYDGGVYVYRDKPVVIMNTKRIRSQDDEDEWEYIGIARPATDDEIAEAAAEQEHYANLRRAHTAVVNLIEQGEQASVPEGAESIGSVRQIGFWEPVAFYADSERVYASYSRYDNDAFGNRTASAPRTPELLAAVTLVCED